MSKFSIVLIAVLLFACRQNQSNNAPIQAGPYIAQRYNEQTDQLAQSIIAQYQQVLTGLRNQDSSYLMQSTQNLMQLNTSLTTISLKVDTTIQQNWVTNLDNINAELTGLVAAITFSDLPEMRMSVHMTGLQLAHLLGQIGFKSHHIYLFQSKDTKYEDGYFWLGLQKTAQDPFHKNHKDVLSAYQILQEQK
jgi:hypothetical protein